MWCANCRADVAAEVAVDNRRIRCATCGAEIVPDNPLPTSAKTREARDLLERWSSQKLHDSSLSASASDLPAPPDSPAQPHGSDVIGIDRGVPMGKSTAAKPGEPIKHGTGDSRKLLESFGKPMQGPTDRGDKSRVHAAHRAGTVPPHFDVQAAAQKEPGTARNWAAFLGPILAYAGVGVLTIGTCLVLLGYFGGVENARYAPTGWLITTAGQMLLFLGVVTLVSGGMEQTTEEVARRIEKLGERILRMEQASQGHVLKGPSIPASRFAETATGAASSASAKQAAHATNAK